MHTETRRIYLDNAATTPLDPLALEAMKPHLCAEFGNANALYREGRDAHSALERARGDIAGLLHAKRHSEIVFTGGGTESDNAALLGIPAACMERGAGRRIIVSAIEHHAVLECISSLTKLGFDVDLVYPRSDGFIHPEDLQKHLDSDVCMVSIMYANNEVGTIQPIEELVTCAHDAGALFHTDAVQALGKVDMDLEASGVDAASFSAHKVYGPKGIGALYLRRGTPFRTQMRGGGQESGRRSGTQNVAGAVGFACALEHTCALIEEEKMREIALRDRLLVSLKGMSSRIHLNVDPVQPLVQDWSGERYLPNMVSFCIDGLESETTLLFLDEAGFAVSGGSACSTASLEPSHVLLAMNIDRDLAFGSVRVSIGRSSTKEDIDAFTDALSSLLTVPALS